MATTATPTLTPSARDFDPNETIRQIGRMNVLGISGGRAAIVQEGLHLPVSNGYAVRVILAANDTYTVSRVFTRSGKHTVHGERTDVYVEDLADAAYYASCFRSYDADEWVTK